MSTSLIRNHADLIWRVADKLRGVYKQSEYGRVILPLTVLRRLDCVLEPTKEAVLAKHAELRIFKRILDDEFKQTLLEFYTAKLYERLRGDVRPTRSCAGVMHTIRSTLGADVSPAPTPLT